MLFLKSLLFIVWNIALGLSIVYTLRWLLFNSKARYFFGKRIPLTPGFIVKYREWLFTKARDILHDYLEQAANPQMSGYLAKWEAKIRDMLMQKTDFVDSWRFVPRKIRETIRLKIVDAFTGIASNLLRKTVPRMAEQLRVEHRIDEFDLQFSSDFFLRYYNQYVHKYLAYFFMGLNLIIGLMNMIFYLIIGG
jgi:hypothetical protein